MRTSPYTVLSNHPFVDSDGDVVRVVMNTATGRVFTLPARVSEQLAAGALSDITGGLDALIGAGLVIDGDAFASAVAAYQDAAKHRTRSFVLMPTAACNFDCGYCGQVNERQSWSDVQVRQLIARIEAAARSGRFAAISVGWFGGEPLMGYRRMQEVSRAAIDACTEYGLKYHAKIVTNGSLLDARRLHELHVQMRVETIEITIDGPSGQHDLLRPAKSGQGTHTRIVDVLRLLTTDEQLTGMSAVVRTNISRRNRHSANRFAQEMTAAGLGDERVSFYPSPVRNWGNDVSAVGLSRTEAVETEIEWMTAYLDHGLHCTVIPTARPAPVCIAVDPTAEVVAPDGHLYACSEQPLVPDRGADSVGHLDTHQSVRATSEFDGWVPTNEMACAQCAVYPLCGGRCPLAWREGATPCPVLRDSLPRRLDLYARTTGLAPRASRTGPLDCSCVVDTGKRRDVVQPFVIRQGA